MNPLIILLVVAVVVGVLFLENRPAQEETLPEDTQVREDTQVQEADNSLKTELEESLPSSTLDMSGQNLTQVPMNVFGRTTIEILDLSGNNLSGALQAEVRHLQNLRVLDLSHNNFTGVPAEVGQLSELEVLDLSFNPITGLPYEIGNLKNLKVLDLRGTSYAEVDLEVIREGLPSSVDIKTD